MIITPGPKPGPPVITPVALPILAISGLLLDHVPPGVAVTDTVVTAPWHTLLLPSMGDGNGLTVTGAVMAHPVGSVYVTLAVDAVVLPTTTLPVSKPVEETILATADGETVHVPPKVTSSNFNVEPWHTLIIPEAVVIGWGSGLTVIVREMLHPVPPLAT